MEVLLLGKLDAGSILVFILLLLGKLLLSQGLAEVVEERGLGRGGLDSLNLAGEHGTNTSFRKALLADHPVVSA